MPVCEICRKKVKEVFKCKECGTRFCKKCGDPARLLCKDCIEYEENVMGQYRPEQEIEIDTD